MTRPSIHCWHPPAAPAAERIEFAAQRIRVVAPWSARAISLRPPALRRARLSAASPGVVSISLPKQMRLKVSSFCFEIPGNEDSAPWTLPVEARGEVHASARTPQCADAPRKHLTTRILPPCDVIKLEDRLQLLLQPPLEAIFADEQLGFPHPPFPYQMDGVAFLFPRHHAILADEMGLGKTMQAITTVRLLLHRRQIESVLLVCPKPLVTNWKREWSLWAPELPVTIIDGDPARRRWQWHEVASPVKIANYELLLRDRTLVDVPDVEFDLVILDEAQRIKNGAGATSAAVRSIRRRRSWALTGTPVENSPDDLVGIFEFLAPGILHKHMKPRAMGRAAGDFILRRTKDRVLTDLPPKLIRDAQLELSPAQRESYRMAEEDGVLRLEGMGDALSIQHVFELVLRLKQICNFDPATGESTKMERLAADLEEVAASGQKAIVFSQWVETLRQIAPHLAALAPLEYHGRVPTQRRERMIEQFRNDRRRHVMLMSYGAGAVGLNLQFAGYVFLYDRWWNPAVEDQAINRAHRIGAAGPVTVTRFVTLGTIEERIDQILTQKRELFDTIFEGAVPREFGLSREEVFGLFKLRTPDGQSRRLTVGKAA